MPEKILQDESRLSPSQLDILKTHPELGYNIIQLIPHISHIGRDVLCHHEHWDGSGYPQGIAGNKIPIQARIINLIDIYYQLRTGNTKPRSHKAAASELLKFSGNKLDPQLVQKFLKINGNDLVLV